MSPSAGTQELKFAERSPVWLRYGSATLLIIIAASMAVWAVVESIWGFYLLAIMLAVAAIWQCRLTKITIMVDEQKVTLTGPFWRRAIQRQDVQEVVVAADNGMHLGLVNWPVTLHEHGSLTRLNMGGSAAITFSDSIGHRYQFVLDNRQDAELVSRAIAS